jgi:hypothetical protein
MYALQERQVQSPEEVTRSKLSCIMHHFPGIFRVEWREYRPHFQGHVRRYCAIVTMPIRLFDYLKNAMPDKEPLHVRSESNQRTTQRQECHCPKQFHVPSSQISHSPFARSPPPLSHEPKRVSSLGYRNPLLLRHNAKRAPGLLCRQSWQKARYIHHMVAFDIFTAKRNIVDSFV